MPLGAPSGAAVLRRLEQRRRLHKSRTASCSSSDASDDDSESRLLPSYLTHYSARNFLTPIFVKIPTSVHFRVLRNRARTVF